MSSAQRLPAKQAANPISGTRLSTAIVLYGFVLGAAAGAPRAAAVDAKPLSISVASSHCFYAIGITGRAIFNSGIAAEVNHRWIRSADYPSCTVAEDNVQGELGPAHQWTIRFFGLPGKPELDLRLRGDVAAPFADIQASVINRTGAAVDVEAIRAVQVAGPIDLRGPAAQDRILSGSFSEDWPPLRIYDLGRAPGGLHRAVGSQLIYNRQSHLSLFVGALSADRFLTILRLHAAPAPSGPAIQAYEADSTGTTEIASDFTLKSAPPEDRIELSLPLASGATLQSEPLLIGAGDDPHRLLETYGKVIRKLRQARPTQPTPMGWWSWTAYYFGLNQAAALTNAEWLAQNLEPLGYNFFHIDEGYQYSRGEYTTPDAALFPGGMAPLERKITALGLAPGLWVAPFEVGERSWVYENHPQWLVHNGAGKPIPLGTVDGQERIFALDVTHPGAQLYLRQTFKVLTRDWGVRYLKLDFMDVTAVEGFYYRPHTTAMEAQRIGLRLIRDAVGDSVLLDKDGSPMLGPVGLVDEGRISQDTGHTFEASKEAASGIAARYYMNGNFYTSDPDAFTVSSQIHPGIWHGGKLPLTFDEAKVSIALAAISGGMFEIGDDLPSLQSEPSRLSLVKNSTLIAMARLGRASTPIDLMDYLPEDEQPSIFYLQEDPAQSILTVFNWTESSRTHTFSLAQFGLPAQQTTAVDVFTGSGAQIDHGQLEVTLPEHSVAMFRLVNTTVLPLHPSVIAARPGPGHIDTQIEFNAAVSDPREPVLAYRWDFGDGVTCDGPHPVHAYTTAGTYRVRVTADFLNGSSAVDQFMLPISGTVDFGFHAALKQRFTAPD